jgi:dinuclear metal center YbgI/SA1388 family protein
MRARELARVADRILGAKRFRDYPGVRNGLQVGHGRVVKKIGWAVDADLESIQRAGKAGVDFLVVHHGIWWGSSALDRKIRARRIREAKRLGVAIYSSHLPLDAQPEIGNAIGLLRALGLERAKRKPFGLAMGREIGWKVALLRSGHARRVGSFEGLGGIRIADFGLRIADLRKREGGKGRRFEGVKGAWPRRSAALQSGGVRVVPAGPKICRKIGVVTGGFGDLDQVVKAGLDTLVTGEADYPTEVKARELGINLILAGHAETETFGAQALAWRLRAVIGRRPAALLRS